MNLFLGKYFFFNQIFKFCKNEFFKIIKLNSKFIYNHNNINHQLKILFDTDGFQLNRD